MSPIRKLTLSVLIATAAFSLGCQKKFKGDDRQNLSSEGCATQVSELFGVARENLIASALGYSISSVRADTSAGRFYITLFDRQGPLEIQSPLPRPGVILGASAEDYKLQYRCLESDCFRLGLVITQLTNLGLGYNDEETVGFILQQESATSYSQICTTGSLTP